MRALFLSRQQRNVLNTHFLILEVFACRTPEDKDQGLLKSTVWWGMTHLKSSGKMQPLMATTSPKNTLEFKLSLMLVTLQFGSCSTILIASKLCVFNKPLKLSTKELAGIITTGMARGLMYKKEQA